MPHKFAVNDPICLAQIALRVAGSLCRLYRFNLTGPHQRLIW